MILTIEESFPARFEIRPAKTFRLSGRSLALVAHPQRGEGGLLTPVKQLRSGRAFTFFVYKPSETQENRLSSVDKTRRTRRSAQQ
jgi:hypothetical protein